MQRDDVLASFADCDVIRCPSSEGDGPVATGSISARRSSQGVRYLQRSCVPWLWSAALVLVGCTGEAYPAFPFDGGGDSGPVDGGAPADNLPRFRVGTAAIDITPTSVVTLAGSAAPAETAVRDTALFVKALVISNGVKTVAVVTLDSLKVEHQDALRAQAAVESLTGIPGAHVLIAPSHTHAAPLYYHYEDRLINTMAEAVQRAMTDLSPVRIGFAKAALPGVAHNRRVMIGGEAYNTFVGYAPERYAAESPIDEDVTVLAAQEMSGAYKAILYSFGCHPAANFPNTLISADYPGHVDTFLRRELGGGLHTFFLLGPSGNVNPNHVPNQNAENPVFGEALGEKVLSMLGDLRPLESSVLDVATRIESLPGRENPVFREEDVRAKFPEQLEHYRASFDHMYARRAASFDSRFSAVRIGDRFALVTNPNELFAGIGQRIKQQSPFDVTLVATLTNGNRGYVPQEDHFSHGAYETWFGEHSFLAEDADKRIEHASLEVLNDVMAVGRIPNASFERNADGDGFADAWENQELLFGSRTSWGVTQGGRDSIDGAHVLEMDSGEGSDSDALVRASSSLFPLHPQTTYSITSAIQHSGYANWSLIEFSDGVLPLRTAGFAAYQGSNPSWERKALPRFTTHSNTTHGLLLFHTGLQASRSRVLVDDIRTLFIANNSFEMDNDDNARPDHWEVASVEGGNRAGDWEVRRWSGDGVHGGHALSVYTGSSGDESAFVRVESDRFPVRGESSYSISLWLRHNGRVRASVREHDRTHRVLREGATAIEVNGEDWTWREVVLPEVLTSSTAAYASVVFEVGGREGYALARIDEVQLSENL